MSYALIKKEIIKTVDPRTYLDKPFRYVIQEGAAEISYNQFPASGATGNVTNFTFANCDPIPGAIVDRKVFMKITFQLEFTGTPANGVPLIDYSYLGNPADLGTAAAPLSLPPESQTNFVANGNDGPRCLPFSQICSSLKVYINNASVSVPLRDYIEPLMRFASHRDYDETELSMTPTMHDMYQDYNDYTVYGSARNCLASYGEQGYRTPRGGFPGVRIVSNPLGDGITQTTAVVEIDIYEPLFISPLDYGVKNDRGLIGITNLKCNVILERTDLLWSHNDVSGQPIDSLAVTIPSGSPPQLEFCYLTPKGTQPIPDVNIYPWYDIEVRQVDCRQLAAGETLTQVVDSIKMQTIPSRMYVFARPENSTRGISVTDTYAFIENISLNFMNNNNLLAGASANQLYQMSCKNGCKMSWAEWSKFVGSVLCIDFSQDVDMSDSQATGLMNPNLLLKFRLTIKNLAKVARNFTIYYVMVYPGLFNLADQQAIPRIGLVSRDDVLDTQVVKADFDESINYYGGADFFGKMLQFGKHFGRKAMNLAKEKARSYLEEHGVDLLSEYGPKAIEAVVDLLGRGYNESMAVDYIRANGIAMSAGSSGGEIIDEDMSARNRYDNLPAGKRMTAKEMGAKRRNLKDRYM